MNKQGYKTYNLAWIVTVLANTPWLPPRTAEFQYQLPPGTTEAYLKSIRYDYEITRLDLVTGLIEVIPVAQNTDVRCSMGVALIGGITNPMVVAMVPAGVVQNGGNMYFYHPQQVFFESLRILQGNWIEFWPEFSNALPVDVTARWNITIEVQEIG